MTEKTMRTTRRRFLAGAGGLAAAGALGSPRQGHAAALQDATPQRGGELIVLQTNDVLSMDPIFSNGETARGVYDALLAWRPNVEGQFEIQPMLATEWETTGDKVVFKLREGVKFHDGSDLNADVVVWNLKRMVQDPASIAKNTLLSLDEENPAQALDPVTVQVNLKRPSAGILTALSDANSRSGALIVSKQAADNNGEESLKTQPVGTGPYKFDSYNTGDRLVVTKNEGYWQLGDDGQPLPYTDGVTYRVIVEASTQFNELRAGTADVMETVRGRDMSAAEQIGHARFQLNPFSGFKTQMFFNANKPLFKDNPKLRQAISHAIDREAMARALSPGLGIPLPYQFISESPAYDTSVPFYEFDLDKAKALIKESGVSTPLEVTLTAHSREVDRQQAQVIQAMLDKIGVKVNLEIVERAAFAEKVRIQNDFEMATRRSSVAIDPADDILLTWAEGGHSAYHRATVPGLLDLARQADAEYDVSKRHQLLVQAQKQMYEAAWFVYLWFEPGNFLIHDRIQNFPAAVWESMREKEWWIEE